jgi:hypothetical protein
LSERPDALTDAADEPKPEEAKMLAPSRSVSSAICRLLRVFVPSRSICAVTLARPGRSAGS